MSYQEITPAEAVKKLTEVFWNNPKASLRTLVRGVAASEKGDKATLYLSQPVTEGLKKQLTALRPSGFDIPLDFEYVCAFHFTGVGAKLRRREGYSGRMGAFVKGSDGRYYALTCGHVVQGEPHPDMANDVLIEGSHHPAKFAVKRVFDFRPSGVNLIDGALAELYPSAVPPLNTMPDGSLLPTSFASYGVGVVVRHAIPNGKEGQILSTSATLLVTVGTSEVTLNDMIIAGTSDGSQFVQQGDSGSLFVRQDNGRPIGILLAKAKSMTASGQSVPSSLAIVCPLQRTLDMLKDEPEAIGHHPGPYILV